MFRSVVLHGGEDIFGYKLSSFPTKYDATNTNRATNLTLACEKINGTVLQPGEVFSFNKVVGERTTKNGFKEISIRNKYYNNQFDAIIMEKQIDNKY